jgi:hypothetical protein
MGCKTMLTGLAIHNRTFGVAFHSKKVKKKQEIFICSKVDKMPIIIHFCSVQGAGGKLTPSVTFQ